MAADEKSLSMSDIKIKNLVVDQCSVSHTVTSFPELMPSQLPAVFEWSTISMKGASLPSHSQTSKSLRAQKLKTGRMQIIRKNMEYFGSASPLPICF